mmetsp:Transcript_63259/g.150885  ORF Transcript_63259/g.150885 Transcript_63259/m.150885 type:complete len:265 (-) Transcript_63259:193-987(-)
MLVDGDSSASGAEIPPPQFLDLDGQKWARTNIQRGIDLVNGEDWMKEFQRRCAQAKPRRMLRQVVSTGDDPQFWRSGSQSDQQLPVSERNRILSQMASETAKKCGQQVTLPTGEDVIFWFNVGPFPDSRALREKVLVTAAACPHQGVPLVDGELREIEELGVKKSCVRCPRHNKNFDLQTGAGLGCSEDLKTYPVRFIDEYKRFYVAVGESEASPSVDMDVDEVSEPAAKKQCLEEMMSAAGQVRSCPTPARPLRPLMVHNTAN